MLRTVVRTVIVVMAIVWVGNHLGGAAAQLTGALGVVAFVAAAVVVLFRVPVRTLLCLLVCRRSRRRERDWWS